MDIWQVDLVDTQQYKSENDNINYILSVIDCFSKYAWSIPLKDITRKEITNAFTDLFKNRKPKTFKYFLRDTTFIGSHMKVN